jgi:hypothetical protein
LGWTAGLLLLLLLGLVVLEIRSLDQPVLLNASVSRTIVREKTTFTHNNNNKHHKYRKQHLEPMAG